VHPSLKLQSNLIEIGACLAVAVGTALLPGAFPAVAWALAAVFGVIAGDLQARSIRAATPAFAAATTALEVRTALMSNLPGRFAVMVQWALIPLLVAAGWWSGNVIVGALGGFALFTAVRDLVGLRAVIGLSTPESPSS
jgi:hypothetical protein